MWVQAVDCLAGRVRPTSWGTRPIIPSDDLVGIDDLNFRKRLQLSYIELGVDSMPSQGRAIMGMQDLSAYGAVSHGPRFKVA